jgi:uncharacterized protein (TIGR00725 family)
VIAVSGPGELETNGALGPLASEVGRLIANAGHVLLTGGLGGVMQAASEGAAKAGGVVVGILPGERTSDANAFVGIAVATGAGQGRNVVLINSADAVIAVGRGYGTLSELALALRARKPVASLHSWHEIDQAIHRAADPADAVRFVLAALQAHAQPFKPASP